MMYKVDEKKLNKKSFWLLLAGIVGAVIFDVVDLILSYNKEFEMLKDRVDAERLERLSTALFRINFVFTIIFAAICAYFVFRLFKNLKVEQGQKYLTFLFVVNIIGLIFNILPLLFLNWTAFVGIVVNIVIIVGCKMQKSYEPPILNDDNSEDL